MIAMADYTKVNLKQVKDMAPEFGLGDSMQSRFARSALGLESTGLTHFTLAPGFRVPFGHKHVEQEEVYVLVSGSARIKIDDEVIELAQWDAVHVPGAAMRNLEAGPEGAEVIAFGERAGEGESTLEQGWWNGG
jgi:mannose-6-phosphate isomerase-like protein (cupin superfamily)